MYPPFTADFAEYNFHWLFPFTFLFLPKTFLVAHSGECCNETFLRIMMKRMRYAHCIVLTGLLVYSFMRRFELMAVAFLVVKEALLIQVLGFPDFPGSLYGISFSCCVVVFFSCRSFDRVRSAGNNTWAYVLGIGREGP